MRERSEMALKIVCAGLAALWLFQLVSLVARRDPLAQLTIPALPHLAAEVTPDGKSHVILVTANHVFDKMPKETARIGYRIANPDGSWSYAPQPLRIRDQAGHELWTHHPSRDVAAIAITGTSRPSTRN